MSPSSPTTAARTPTAPSRPAPGLAAGAVAVTVLSWAVAFPVIHIGLQTFAPIPLASLRFALAALLALAWLTWTRPALPRGADAVRFFACGGIGVALYNVLLNTGQTTVSAGAASFIVNTLPVFTAILAAVFLRERFRLWGWIGTGVSLCGVALIASGQPGGLSFGAGASLVLAAALCSAIYFVLQRPLVARHGALNCAAYTLVAGALCLLPWLPAAITTAFTSATATGWLAVAFLGVVPAALGYVTWTYALGQFGAARAATFLYLVPPVATGLAYVLTGEVPATLTLSGGLIAIAGVVLVNTKAQR